VISRDVTLVVGFAKTNRKNDVATYAEAGIDKS
jgi:hypothetical protein